MLRFDLLAKWARLRASARIQNNSKNKGDNSRMYAAVNQLFYERVLDACRRIADTPAAVRTLDSLRFQNGYLQR